MHRLGITMGGYILFGYPGEEWSDIKATIDLVREIAPVDYSTSVAHPMPGTEFFDLVRDLLNGDHRWDRWAAEDPDAVHWEAPYSAGFYRILESLLHAEYDLGLEFRLKTWAKSKVLKGVLAMMRAAGDGKERILRYRDPRFQGWRGLRSAAMSERHRVGHQQKAERMKRARLRVVT